MSNLFQPLDVRHLMKKRENPFIHVGKIYERTFFHLPNTKCSSTVRLMDRIYEMLGFWSKSDGN